MKIGFDNEKYLKMQSEHIRERIGQFDNKLYLEFGGKLFDDYHASRVLPGFQPDSKLCMLRELSETKKSFLNTLRLSGQKIRISRTKVEKTYADLSGTGALCRKRCYYQI